jgi:hypothetical protein
MSTLSSGNSSEHLKPNSMMDEITLYVIVTSLLFSIFNKPSSTTSIILSGSDAFIHCLIVN